MTVILVLDVGTTSVRAAVVDERLAIVAIAARPFPPATPFPGLVEFDAAELARSVLDAADEVIAAVDEPITAVGITNQRASTIVWDRATGEPIGPALGWQDLRTVGRVHHGQGRARPRAGPEPVGHQARLAARPTSTGAARPRPLLRHRRHAGWRGRCPAARCTSPTTPTPPSPACSAADGVGVERRRSSTALGIPAERAARHRRLAAASSARRRRCPARRRSPPSSATSRRRSSARAASRPGRAKITFGTGGMLDLCRGAGRAGVGPPRRARHVPDRRLVARRRADVGRRGDHAVGRHATSSGCATTSASSPRSADSHDVAAAVDDADGVVYVPALLGLGTPHWDYGARGHAARRHPGHDRGRTSCAPCSRASPSAAPTSSRPPRPTPGWRSSALRVDGGMSANPTFVQALADATGRPVEVSPVVEATTLGAGVPRRPGHRRVGRHRRRRPRVAPGPGRRARRGRSTAQAWARAVERAAGWIPELSALDF